MNESDQSKEEESVSNGHSCDLKSFHDNTKWEVLVQDELNGVASFWIVERIKVERDNVKICINFIKESLQISGKSAVGNNSSAGRVVA